MFTLFRRKPITALLSSLSLLRGKAAFKAEIAGQVSLDPTTLPYNQSLLNHLCAEHAVGRNICLATVSNEKQARGIADYLGIVAGDFAGRERVNLQSSAQVLIVWISRIWMLAHSGKLDEDPVVFARTDRLSPSFALLIVRGAV